MSDILFGQSYYLRFDPKLWQAMQPYPPLGTLYAASFIRARGFRVAMFDAMLAESEQDWDDALREHKPRYAVIYEDNFNYLSKMCLSRMREAALRMIGMAKKHNCVVIVCGADATDHYTHYLSANADFVLLGEGEETLSELLEVLENRSTILSVDQVKGLAFTSVLTQKTIVTPRRPDIRNLDTLPFPAWDLVDIDKYRGIWQNNHGYFSINMVTTRGCPYQCNWCAKPIWGQRYNVRSPENVIAELEYLIQQIKPDHIWFADDIFGLKPGWVDQFAALITQKKLKTPFKCLSRADLITENTARALELGGCRMVWIGAESGSQKILDAMDKGTLISDIELATELLKMHHITVGFFLQFGYPGESWNDISLTRQMVRRCMPDDIGISVSYPLPGTKFYTRVKAELGEKQNWVDSDDLAMLYQGPFPQMFYRILHRFVHAEYRLHKMSKQPTLAQFPRIIIETLRYAVGWLRLRGYV